MTSSSPRSLCSLIHSVVRDHAVRIFFVACMSVMMAPAAKAVTVPTTTTLVISSTSVPYKTPITLTATVKAGGLPVSSGLVLFCDATATFCENNSALGIAQLTFPNATAVVKIGSGPIGVHSYKAVFRATNAYATSTSNTVSYSVTGTYASQTSLSASGSPGSYTLTTGVAGIGSLTTGPTGTVTFLDISAGNSSLGSTNLVVSALSNTFIQGSPFAIAASGATLRSVAIASAYLDSDNNLDVVTGDAEQTITVLLGKGDGTFKPKVTYPGCTVGRAYKIVLADFNRDGNTDIAVGCSDATNGGLVILLGNGDGSFQAPVAYSTGDVFSIAIGDFNNDGILDVAVSDQLQQNVTVFTGAGDGTFSKTATISTSKQAHGIVVADFNQDGNDDIAFAVTAAASGSTLSDLYVANGKGNGTFQAPVLVASQIGEFLTTGDTNADNIPDIAASTITRPGGGNIGNSLYVLIGKGDGTFLPTVTYVSDIPSDPHFADVNGDGIPDIIAGGSSGALVYEGNGDGTFQAYQEPGIGGFALTYAVNAGDYNNDGNADLIGTDADTPRAAVSLSQVQQTANASALSGVAVLPLGSGIHQVDASYSGDSIYIGSLSSKVPLTAAPVPTNLTLTVAPTSATLSGQAVTLTAVLNPYTVGPPTTTTDGEKVSFYNGSTLLGKGVLNSGVATLVTTALPVGSQSLQALFAGDANYSPSSSNQLNVTVTSVLISSSLNPSVFAQSVTFTATLVAGKTGNVTFMDGPTTLGTSVISGTTATFTTSTLSVGTHGITAVYNSATSPVLSQVVNQAAPTVTVTTSGPSVYGDTVTITATVPAGPTGTITITSGGVTLGSGTISGGVVTITTATLPTGSDPITATYGGDTNYASAVGTTTQQVAKISPASTLTSSVNPSLPGASVTFTDTLPASIAGTVTFTSGATTLGTSTLVSGVATVSTSTLPLGSDPITATYNGDSNTNTSVATLTQTVAKTTPTVTVTTSGPSTYGGSVTITVTVPSGATGTITITSGGVTLGTGTISGGVVTITTTTLPTGTDTITATYGGDSTNNTATGTTTQTVAKASVTMTLTSSANPSAANQSVTFTATPTSGATGTVTFTNGATTLGTSTIAAGVATVTTSSLPAGSDTITATYSGDTNHSTATATLTQTVNKATPAVTVTTSGPSTYGAPVTITAAVPTGTTGTITITSGGVTLGSGTISAGSVTVTTSTLPIGTDVITASYGGDTNNNSATGTVNQTVTRGASTVVLTSSANPSTVNQSVTFTATLPTTATGTVTFTSGSTVLGTVTLTNGVATVTTSALPVGSNSVTASYSGDTSNNSSTASLTQTVNKNSPTVTVTTPGPSTYGGPVTITTTVPPGATGTVTVTSGGVTLGTGTVSPGGTVTITTTTLPVGNDPITSTYSGDGNNNPGTGTTTQTVNKDTPVLPPPVVSSTSPLVGTPVTISETVPAGVSGPVTFYNGSTPIGTAPIVNGVATITTSTLPLGTDQITATTPGDTNNNPATSPAVAVTVVKTAPEISLTSSMNPSTVNQPVTFTATAPVGATGTITFLDGATILGTGTLVSNQASLTISSLTTGSHTITASYNGDTNNNAATSVPLTQFVNKATPTLPPPVLSSTSLTPGSPETITETVPAGVGGPVTFYNGSTPLGTAPIVNGVATLTVNSLPIGTNPITATTPGDANNNPATSPAVTVTVAKAPVTVTITSSANPAAPNVPVTFTVTVPAGATAPVTFFDGSTVLGTAQVNAAGVATFTTSTLTAGAHPITATYPGDTTYNSGTSPVLLQTVGKIPTTITLVESSTAQLFNNVVTFTATVAAPIPTPTGMVTFYDGTTVLGTAALSTNGGVVVSLTAGNAAFITSGLAAGTHQITAVYSGDTTFASSTSAPAANAVEDFTIVNSGAASQDVFPGAATTYNFKLTPLSASTFLNNVTLTVTGLPPGSTYTLTPAAVASGSGETSLVLKVQTSSSLSAQNHTPHDPASRELPIALGMLGLAGLGTVRKLRKKLPRPLLVLLLMIGSLLPIAVLSGCAGGYFTLTPHTYTVTVTGTEGSIQHTATATLVVQ